MHPHLVAVVVLHLDYTFCRMCWGYIYGNKILRRAGSANMWSLKGLLNSFFKVCVAQTQCLGYLTEGMLLAQHHRCYPQIFRDTASVLLGFAPVGKSGLNFW